LSLFIDSNSSVYPVTFDPSRSRLVISRKAWTNPDKTIHLFNFFSEINTTSQTSSVQVSLLLTFNKTELTGLNLTIFVPVFWAQAFAIRFIFTEFTEAAKVHSNDDGISRHRLAPFNAYHLTQCW